MKNATFPGPYVHHVVVFFSLVFLGAVIFGCNLPTEPAEALEIKHDNVVKVLFHNKDHVTIMKKVDNSKEIEVVTIYTFSDGSACNVKYFADVSPGETMWAIEKHSKNLGGRVSSRLAEIHVHENFQMEGGTETGGKGKVGYTSVIE